MANIQVKNGAGADVYLKATGAGSSGDPHVPEHTISGTVTVNGSGVTQPVSAASLPLPTGAATSAKQDTGNTSLATLAGAVAGTEMQVDVVSMPTTTVTGTVAVTNAGITTIAGAVAGTEVQVDVVAALPGGTNAIGTVGITEKTITTQVTTEADSGDNTLVSAPAAGTRIVVSAIVVQNESATATTIILKDGTTAKRRALLQNQGDGVAWQFAPGREWKLGDAAALVLNLSGANSHGVTVDYWTESV